jgi:hypothetical protein
MRMRGLFSLIAVSNAFLLVLLLLGLSESRNDNNTDSNGNGATESCTVCRDYLNAVSLYIIKYQYSNFRSVLAL